MPLYSQTIQFFPDLFYLFTNFFYWSSLYLEYTAILPHCLYKVSLSISLCCAYTTISLVLYIFFRTEGLWWSQCLVPILLVGILPTFTFLMYQALYCLTSFLLSGVPQLLLLQSFPRAGNLYLISSSLNLSAHCQFSFSLGCINGSLILPTKLDPTSSKPLLVPRFSKRFCF